MAFKPSDSWSLTTNLPHAYPRRRGAPNTFANVDHNCADDDSTRMISIQSLLNPAAVSSGPSGLGGQVDQFHSQTQLSLQDDDEGQIKKQKLVKDNAVFIKHRPSPGTVLYPPYECTEIDRSLAPHEQQEISRQHLRFRVYPSGPQNGGLIGDHSRRIPYASDKKGFYDKTGRDAFDGEPPAWLG